LIDTSGVGGGVLSNIVQATFEPGVSVGTPRGYVGSVIVAVFTKAVEVGDHTTPYKVTTTGHAFNCEVIFVAGNDVAGICVQPLILYADNMKPLFQGNTSLNIVFVTGHPVLLIVIWYCIASPVCITTHAV
jgi:hypothetical protein